MILTAIENATLTHDNEPAWLQRARQEQHALFMRHGVPTQDKEHWKYTNLNFINDIDYPERHASIQLERTNSEVLSDYRLPAVNAIRMVFIDGHFAPEHSDLDDLPPNMVCCDIQSAWNNAILQKHWACQLDADKYTFASLSAALCSGGLFLYVPDNMPLAAPIHLINVISREAAHLYNLRHVIVLGKHTNVTILHESISMRATNYFHNALTTIAVGQSATLQYVKLQQESEFAAHLQTLVLQQERDSHVSLVAAGNAAQFARDDVVVDLCEPGAQCQTSGFYHTTRPGQYVDHHVAITHSAAQTQSEMVYKGIVDNKTRAVFNGRLLVKPEAQKINAMQANHHLLLSAQAEAYSKPELEIYADDVKCRHGATTGQIDQDALFYLRARGIDEKTAINMLLAGFADEVLQRISHPSLQHYVHRRLK